jgi:6-hydroxycyclohex-1-ene-1-carbonyl-CoA dehydrogenase
MKAIRLVAAGAPLEILDVPVPDPDPDQVLVRVAGCGVCHTDIGFWKEGVPARHSLPLTLGHEITGVVVSAGADWRHLEGREVIVPAVIPCGACELCAAGRGNICQAQVMPGNDLDGGFAEYVAVPARGICVLEDRGSYALAELAVVADAVTTPYQGILRSGLLAGDVAIVIGVGGIGTYAVQIAAALGARVIAIDIDQEKLTTIADHGASLTLDSSALDFKTLKSEIKAKVKDWGCSPHGWKIFECSGHPSGQKLAYGLLGIAGTLIVLGFTLEKIELRLSNVMAFDATIAGNWGCRPELYREALDLIVQGRITLKPFIETHSMSQGPDVVQAVADHTVRRRAVLVPD